MATVSLWLNRIFLPFVTSFEHFGWDSPYYVHLFIQVTRWFLGENSLYLFPKVHSAVENCISVSVSILNTQSCIYGAFSGTGFLFLGRLGSQASTEKKIYRISANSFRGNYSFLNLTLCTVHTGAETIQGRKLFKGGNYSRKYGKCFGPIVKK